MSAAMLCRDPYMPRHSLAAFPCGKCDPCKRNKRKLWMSRIFLESMCHEKSCFLTLTYDDDHLPKGGTLVPSDLQKYWKRLRKAIYPVRIRYFACGEYGDESWRPHYHAAVFGLGPDDENVLREAWMLDGVPIGFVYVGDLSAASSNYIAGYVTKKMTGDHDVRLQRSDGSTLFPEFGRMSNRPGIGAPALSEIAKSILTPAGCRAVRDGGDVPTFFKFGNKTYPLGRYLRSKLREAIDFYNVNERTGEVNYGSPVCETQKRAQEMRALFEAWLLTTENSKKSFKKFLSELDDGKVALQKAKFKDRRKL